MREADGRLRYRAELYSAAFSPDGSRIVTAGGYGYGRLWTIWDAKTGAEVMALRRTSAGVYSAMFSPDGSRIVTEGSLVGKAWDAQTGAEDPERLNRGGLTEAGRWSAMSPDGGRILTGAQGGPVRILDILGRLIVELKLGIPACSATFSPDGSRVVAGYYDGTARVWDAQNGAPLLTLKGHNGRVCSARFSADGSRIITGSQDGTARIWYAGFYQGRHWPNLQLMSWGDGSRVPTSGAGLVIAGTDRDDLLHIRTFDRQRDRIDTFETRDSSGGLRLQSVKNTVGGFGLTLSDELESSLPTPRSVAVGSLKQQLPGLLPPHVLSGAERDQVLSAVAIIIGSKGGTY